MGSCYWIGLLVLGFFASGCHVPGTEDNPANPLGKTRSSRGAEVGPSVAAAATSPASATPSTPPTSTPAQGTPLIQADLYVSPSGNDASVGSFAWPFATLERAQGAVRVLIARGLVDEVRVAVRGGIYELDQPLELGPKDSGTATHGITWIAYPKEKVRVVGAKKLKAEKFFPVLSSSPVWSRMDPSARGKLMEINLIAQGITDFGKLNKRGFWNQGGPSGLELFFNQQPMQLGRWPDKVDFAKARSNVLSSTGFVLTDRGLDKTRFTYTGTRPERWSKAEEVHVYGFFKHGWADTHVKVTDIDTATRTITLDAEPYFGLAGNRPYYAENLLEEITVPGEWYVNRATGKLYFWPPGPILKAEIFASRFAGNASNWFKPMLLLKNTNYVTFAGFVFEMARAGLVEIDGGSHNKLVNCVLRNAGAHAALISGTHNGLDRCEIYGAGNYGVELKGGDRYRLIPAKNYVRNCDIHHYARWCRSATPGVRILGVGQIVQHNNIHHAPVEGIAYSGNDHLIEFNDIHNVCQWIDDGGAIYCAGRFWTYRGTRVRHNFIHHVQGKLPRGGHGEHGIYLDDTSGGQEVFGNVLYEIAGGSGVYGGGGRDNLIENNIIVKCANAFSADSRGISILKPNTVLDVLKQLKGVNYQQPPWSTAYPKLAAVPNTWAKLHDPNRNWLYPEGSTFSRNLGWKNQVWTKEVNWGFGGTGALPKFKIRDNIQNADPRFADESKLDLRLAPSSPAFTIGGFRRIPFEQIGITPARTAKTGP